MLSCWPFRQKTGEGEHPRLDEDGGNVLTRQAWTVARGGGSRMEQTTVAPQPVSWVREERSRVELNERDGGLGGRKCSMTVHPRSDVPWYRRT